MSDQGHRQFTWSAEDVEQARSQLSQNSDSEPLVPWSAMDPNGIVKPPDPPKRSERILGIVDSLLERFEDDEYQDGSAIFDLASSIDDLIRAALTCRDYLE